MIQNNTHEQLIKKWKHLPKYKYGKEAKGLLYGMLGAIAGSGYKSGISTIRCYSCYNVFATRLDAQTHPCPNEKEFREVTGRVVPVNDIRQIVLRPENIISMPPEQKIVEIDPESWVRWNFDLLQERDKLRESINDLTNQMAVLRRDKEQLHEQVNKMRTTVLHNQQAMAYEDYNRR